MLLYPGVTDWGASQWAWRDRQGWTGPIWGVIHATAAPGSTARDVFNYFMGNAGACSHFVIGKAGDIYQCADPHWAAGANCCPSLPSPAVGWFHGVNANFGTWSIEILKNDTNNADVLTEAQFNAVVSVSKWLCQQCGTARRAADSHGGIMSHSFLDPVHRPGDHDPGPFDWIRYYKDIQDVKLPWYSYPIGVPFGNPNYDVNVGGSHDMTLLCPPNYPVTSIVSGSVSDISAPTWGKQVGVKLDVPYNGIEWFHYLHLSATNPALKVGSRINRGDLIGWVGGANSQAQYAGTSNPTGQNFLNTPEMSSQVQVGIALMRGPAYGGTGWQTFPPIDKTLDPTPILNAAKGGYPVFSNELCVALWNSYFLSIGKPPPPRDTGIFNSWRALWISGRFKGCCLGGEYPVTLPNGHTGVAQNYAGGTCIWDKVTGTPTWI